MNEKNLIKKTITDTLKENYMPYAMSVIVSRAIPEIDGFKPSHRKLLYTMYNMGLLTKDRVKCADVVGQTMGLNPHGDAAIYETLVRLTRGNQSLLHPFIDSKGNFGRAYSRDMAYAAPRYTEVKLSEICKLVFHNIDTDTVDFVPNYDGKRFEPLLLPTLFPNLLVTPNLGIAVGMASNICSFNLKEVCETTIALIKNKEHKISTTLIAPDFSTGGEILYDQETFDSIYEKGLGSFKVRGKWTYNKKNNTVEIYEIPYTTNIESIIDKTITLVKTNKLREINDIRNATDKDGLKITIDLKRGSDVDVVMSKLNSLTPLTDTFSCNFNILINGKPMVLGVRQILEEWLIFRTNCITRETIYTKNKLEDRLNLLKGLDKILLDIDKAIKIIRHTEEDSQVVPNLMNAFSISEIQADFIAEIKLRNLNKEYLLNKIKEIDDIEKEIAHLNAVLENDNLIKKRIISELTDIIKKYGQDRKTTIAKNIEEQVIDKIDFIPDFEAKIFLSRDGYIKKIPINSYRMANQHKLKDDDCLLIELDGTNKSELLFFTDSQNAYTLNAYDLPEQKASNLGDYLPNILGLENEKIVHMCVIQGDYNGFMLFGYENGKMAKVPILSYKSSRKKLVNAYFNGEKLIFVKDIQEDVSLFLLRNDDKCLVTNSTLIPTKVTKNTKGVQILNLKKKSYCNQILALEESHPLLEFDLQPYTSNKIPASGAFITDILLKNKLQNL
ncbi:MAG: DNA gyrase subunit A [Lachnospirales bacterium]